MHFTRVLVQRNETAALPALVGAWEVPLLQAKHGDERVQVEDALQDFPAREWPMDPRSEMQRLAQLYGRTGSGDNDPSYAERVYGQGQAGVKALGEAMAAARAAAPKPKAKGKSKPAGDLVGEATG